MVYRFLTNHPLLKSVINSLFCVIFLMNAPSAMSHPHSWIEMKTRVTGKDDMITGFHMNWVFDPMSSAYMLKGDHFASGNEEQAFVRLTVDVMKNIEEAHYFTHFYDGDNSLEFGQAQNGKLFRSRARIVLSFDLPLAKPQPVTKDSLKLVIFEPSYYTDMNWPTKQDISLSKDLAKLCTHELIQPNPTAEQMKYAFNLPADADVDNTLGQLFTQKVVFRCSQPVRKGDKK